VPEARRSIGAIQQAKMSNVIDWVTGLVLRRGAAR